MKIISTQGFIGYHDAISKMNQIANDVLGQKCEDIIWFLEHPSIYTIGKMGSLDDVKTQLNFPLIESDRGGKITYHGPGQLIIYFIFDLNAWDKNINKFISFIEEAGIQVLNHFGLKASREKTAGDKIPGLWIDGKKIASIGMHVNKWITTHGMSFNINTDLSHFESINVCGQSEPCVTSLETLGIKTDRVKVEDLFTEIFEIYFSQKKVVANLP